MAAFHVGCLYFSTGSYIERNDCSKTYWISVLRKDVLRYNFRNPDLVKSQSSVGRCFWYAGMNMLAKLDHIGREMRKMENLEIPVRHYFSEGLYAREIIIPKDSIVLGKIHKYEQLNICSKGDLSVSTEDGVKRVQAPFTTVSMAGTQRIAYAHEETVWTTIHPTSLKDVEEIERYFIAQDYNEYLEFVRSLTWHG
jgi:hypothetical protein